MKKKHVFSRRSLLLVGAMALVSSCQDYEPFSDQTVQDKAYTHEFVKQFGEIDPNQDWDLFGQLARHIGPTTRANKQDMPTLKQLSSTITITRAKHANYTKVLPELNIPNNPYENTNLGQVTQDFLTTARTFTLAPVHWTTSAQDEIGIYWYVEDEEGDATPVMGKDGKLYFLKHFKIFDTQKCNLQIHHANDGSEPYIGNVLDVNAQWTSDNDYLISHPIEVTVPISIPEYGFYIRNRGGDGNDKTLGTRYSEWNLNPISRGPIEEGKTYEQLIADDKLCSFTATFNLKDLGVDPNDNHQYLCFEDWYNWGDQDLNDVVYYAEGLDDTNIKDNSSINENAILVCEDLKQFDFDFNDIVLGLNFKEEVERKFEHKNAQEVWIDGVKYQIPAHWECVEIKVLGHTLYTTPMAAGGAFETNVTIWGVPKGEIHYLLNEDGSTFEGTGSKKHPIINAGEKYEPLADAIPLTLESYPWNVGTNQGQYATYLSQLFAEGLFELHCYDGDAKIIIKNKPEGDSTNSEGDNKMHYEEGHAPQMMLLPYYFEWPQEMTHISLAYPGFPEWVSDITKTSWIFDTQVPELITERGDFVPDINPDEESTGQLITGTDLPHNNDNPFYYYDQYGTTVYNNGEFIDLTGIAEITNELSKAELTVVYSYKPQASIYIDDANGNLLVWENGGNGGPNTTTYTISAKRFNQAIASGGIWILPGIVNGTESDLAVERVTIKIIGATEEYDPQHPINRHELHVSPASISFNGPGETATISAGSNTGATEFTYASTNTKIATVDENGVVTAVASGNATIVVTAKASGEYAQNVKRIPVTVGRKTISLNMGSPTDADDIVGDSWIYSPAWQGAPNPMNYVNGQSYTVYDRIKHITATTSEDLSKWGNGGTLTIHYDIDTNVADFSPNIFRIKNRAGDVLAGDFTNYNTNLSANVTISLSSDDIASCRLDNGQYEFIIEYRFCANLSNEQLTSD